MTHEQFADIITRLARIETNQEAHAGLEPRVRDIEKWQHKASGVAALLGVAGGGISAWLARHSPI